MKIVAAIDLGGTKTLVGLVDQSGRVLVSRKMPTQTQDSFGHLQQCQGELAACLKEASLTPGDISGLGITVPGLADIEKGILVRAVFAGWQNIGLRDFYQPFWPGSPIRIDNDVNACALAELAFGWQDRYRDFIWITVSTGVGGAVVINRELVRGTGGLAGEIGHIKVEFEHPLPCPCGQSGCLEAHGSGTAITKYIAAELSANPDFAESFRAVGLAPDAKGCAVLARQGNPAACRIYQKAASYLGRGISHVVNCLNPQAVIIGGGIANDLDLLQPELRQTVAANVFEPLQGIDIVATKLGYQAGLLGAAALGLG